MCKDYYTLQFMDPSVDTSPIAPALAEFFDDVLGASVSQLNFKAIVDGLGEVLFRWDGQSGKWPLLKRRNDEVFQVCSPSLQQPLKSLSVSLGNCCP